MNKPFVPNFLALTLGLAVAGSTCSTHAATDTWSGATSAIWDTAASNWLNDGSDTVFNSGNDALFTGTPTNNVTTATGLTIGAITLDNTFTGSTTLSGANTVSGPITVNAGTLLLGNNSGAGAATINLGGGTLGASAALTNVTNTINVTGTSTLGQNANLAVTLSGSLTGAGTLQNKAATGSSPNLFFKGDLSGFTGTMAFTNANSNTSATWRFGATGGTTVDLSNATVNLIAGPSANVSLGFVDAITVANTMKIGALTGGGVFQGSFNGTNNVFNILEVGALNTSSTFSGVLGRNTSNMMQLSLTKVGTGKLTLSGANINTGAMIVTGGTLQMNSTNATAASVTVNSGATLALNIADAIGFVANKNVPTINSGGTINNITSAGRVTLWNGLTMTGGTLTSTSTGDANGAYALSGTVTATSDASGVAASINGSPVSLQNRNVASGIVTFDVARGSATPASDMTVSARLIAYSGAANVGLTKTGNGILTLTGSNTYTGATTVSNGTLIVGASGSLGATAATVASGAAIGGDGTLGGSLTLSSGAKFVFSLTDTLTVNGASVSFGGFSVSDLVGLNNTVALGTYTLIDGSAAFDFTNVSNFGVGNAFDLGAGKSAYFQSGSLQLVVVPEPSTCAMLLGGIGMLIVSQRRRRHA